MKKIIPLCAIGLVMVMCGCRVPSYVANNSFGAPYPGAIYSHVTAASFIGNKLENTNGVEILGDAYGTASASDYLTIVSAGNCGIAAAKEDALKRFPGADDIVNIEVETRHISVLSVFTTITTIVRGKAIKYKK